VRNDLAAAEATHWNDHLLKSKNANIINVILDGINNSNNGCNISKQHKKTSTVFAHLSKVICT
jgi:hypothetical protein